MEIQINVIKKNGYKMPFDINLIFSAVKKSADRVMVEFTEELKNQLRLEVETRINDYINQHISEGSVDIDIDVSVLHNIVELSLDNVNENVAKSYRDYRDYKTSFVQILNDVYKKAQSIMYIGDKENANTDSALVSTKRSLIFNQLNKELYQKFNMRPDEVQACKDGYIYVHDMSARRDTFNCCIYNVEEVLTGGFEMGNVWYNEPKTIDTAFDVIGDIVLSAAAQQYGGFTIPEIDKLLEPYALKTYIMYQNEFSECNGFNDFRDMATQISNTLGPDQAELFKERADKYALKKLTRDIEQGFQGWEYKFNTVGSSRGDYPFISVSFGLSKSTFGKLINTICLRTRMNGQGKEGNKKPVLFPKLTFLYDKNLHGPGGELEDVFMAAIDCSQKAMYPDYLSLTGEGYIPSIYKKYGKVVSLMGCVHGSSSVKCMINSDSKRYQDLFYEGSIENLWKEMERKYGSKEQIDGDSRFKYISFDEPYSELFVWDQDFGYYTGVKKMIKNVTNKWLKIKLTNDYELICTPDHPLPVPFRGRIRADEVNVGDELWITNSNEENMTSRVASITRWDCNQEASYDLETITDHFTVNSIYSHNCRASLSPWFERGGMEPADDTDEPVFVGRFNLGAISLHLPMILAKARQEGKDFYEVLDYYMEMIRRIHKRTYDYLGEMKASTNPLGFCEGGLYGGHLKPSDKIKPILKPMTMSFGITALNELQRLYNGKSIREDGEFALEVMRYINKKINEYKQEDGILYAVYGTPAENLCGLQVTQFRKKYGIIENVSDRGYVSNSFHNHVSEDMSPIEKQDTEGRFWDLFNGGKIQYCRYPVNYNKEAMITLVRRAMDKGFYEGVNMSLAYCDDCGYSELDMDVCPKCGSRNLTKIDRMNGYLAYSRVNGDTRLNNAKMEEISDRKSM